MYFGFENISIEFGKKKVLSNFTVNIPKGKIVTIIGENGCGKSSLLKTVSRAVKQSSGEVVFNDKQITKYKLKELARSIGYLPQVHYSPPDIDVYTLVSYGRYPYMGFRKVLTHDDKDVINDCIHITGLDGMRNQKIGTLSGGERQRAWIAMTLCQQPDILILDEPTTYLDISHQLDTLELIKKLNKERGITIIMVLHDINMAARYSDILIAIKDGNVYACGCPDDVITQDKLKDIFDLETNIINDEKNNCPFFIPLKRRCNENK